MNEFNQVLQDIKEVKIQGATNIALAGIISFSKNPTKENYQNLILIRPTEPLLQNSLKLILKSKHPKQTAKKVLSYIENSEKKINSFGYKLIENNMNIFTHCHSSTVISILKYAHSKGKRFVVYNTETQPLMQGRKTAEELANLGIKVIHLPDLAIEEAIKKCDLFLFGADAFLDNKIINKTGTNLIAEIAKLHNVPRYCCGASLKYAKKIKIEYRTGRELWNERKKNIQIINPAFSELKSKYLSGVVSELGILHYKGFIKLAKKNLRDFADAN